MSGVMLPPIPSSASLRRLLPLAATVPVRSEAMSAPAVTAAVSARSTLRPKPTVGRPDAQLVAAPPALGPDGNHLLRPPWAGRRSAGPAPPHPAPPARPGPRRRRCRPPRAARPAGTGPPPRGPPGAAARPWPGPAGRSSAPRCARCAAARCGRSRARSASARPTRGARPWSARRPRSAPAAARLRTAPSRRRPGPAAPASGSTPSPCQSVRAQRPRPSEATTSSPARRRSTRPRWCASSSRELGCGGVVARRPGPPRRPARRWRRTAAGPLAKGRTQAREHAVAAPAAGGRHVLAAQRRRTGAAARPASGVSSVGVCTATWTKRSPRPRPRRCGTPAPRIRSMWPCLGARGHRVGGGCRRATGPAPRCPARPGPRSTVSVVCRSSPWRSKRGSGVTARCTKSEPLGPPRCPAAPRSARRSVEPSSTPAGTSTVKVVSSMRRPSPRHSGHGCGIISPEPEQREQATLVTTWPSSDWRTRRSSPVPWQSAQVIGRGARRRAPAGAGGAGHGQADRDLLAAAEDGLGELEAEPHLGVGPRLGPRRREPAPAMEPKKASKMSPSPPSKPKPPMPPPADWPKTPSGP